jgi:hypothetical protein
MNAALAVGAGWMALGLIPLGACAGLITRRFLKGSLRVRMRPHYILGYAALIAALLHLSLEMGGINGADSNGLRLAALALLGLGMQALIGSNLQSPGDYRKLLRGWHLVTFAVVMLFALGHIVLNR